MSYRTRREQSYSSTDFHPNFDNIAKILLIGETGAGKSTFINYLCNYFYKSDFNNLKIAIPCKYHPYPTEQVLHQELNIHDNTQSKTNNCNQYLFTDSIIQKQYLFIDTPGLSDTRGFEQNEININKILNTIIQLGNLTTIIIVVNGSVSRLTTYLRFVIEYLNDYIPNIILENVIVILTNVKRYESSFDLKILNLHGKIYPFYMQNNAFVSDPQTWTKSIRDELQLNWNCSMNQIKLILQTIDSFKKIPVQAFIQIQQNRNDIKSFFHQLRLDMIQIEKIQNELSQLDFGYQEVDRDILTYRDCTRYLTIELIEILDAPYYNRLCTICNQVCQENCQFNEITINDGDGSSQCQQCRNHCSSINHYHAKKTIRITSETVHNILIDLKAKYEYTHGNRNNFEENILTITNTKNILERALIDKYYELKRKTKELSDLYSSFNLAQELKNFIKQFKIESDLLDNYEIRSQNERLLKSLTKLTRLIEENQDKFQHKQSSIEIIYKDQSVENKPADITHMKTNDLVELHNKTTDPILIRSILAELHQRAQGKSTNPLLTSSEILKVNKYLEKYKQKTIYDLTYLYRQLQKKINTIIDSNILKIIDVDPELLIEIFIIQTLLDDKEKNEEILTSQSIPKSLDNSAFPLPFNPLPYPSNEQSVTSNMNLPPIGFTHILSTPYPLSHEPSFLPPLPSDYSLNNQQSETGFRLEDYQYVLNHTNSSILSNDHHDFPPLPRPINNQQSQSNIGFSFNNTLQNQHTISSNQTASVPDVLLSNTNHPISSKPPNLSTNIDNEKLRTITTSRLLLMYAKATLQENETDRNIFYDELERRCYGDYPLLMNEKKSLLEEKIKINQMKTIDELLLAQATIKQKIHQYLKDDDVTLIDDIPTELIVEANALNQLITSKRKF